MDITALMTTKAKQNQARIVICEGWEKRCLQAASDILAENLAKIILLGKESEIRRNAEGLDISAAVIIDPDTYPKKDELVNLLIEKRKNKGMAEPEARKLINSINYFACLLALSGEADAVAGSAIAPTGALMRPALQLLRKPGTIASEIGIIKKEKTGKIMFISDCSLNNGDSPEDLAQVGINASEVVKGFGIVPKIAFLSYSTKGSGGNHPAIEKVREAAAIAKRKCTDCIVDGELQLDAAVSPDAAKTKCPDSPLEGEANTLIFPTLDAANIFAHGLEQFSDWKFEFTVMSGLSKPVGVVGRITTPETVKNVILSCAMQVL